jgi:hypothetical protein
MWSVSTYWGKDGTNDVVIPDLEAGQRFRRVNLEGTDPQQLAEQLWEWMDPDYRVAVVAAMFYKDKGWDFSQPINEL